MRNDIEVDSVRWSDSISVLLLIKVLLLDFSSKEVPILRIRLF